MKSLDGVGIMGMTFGWCEGSGTGWDDGDGVLEKLGSILKVDPKVSHLRDSQIPGSRPALVADDVSLTPRDDVLIDIDDKEPLIPIQVRKMRLCWEDPRIFPCSGGSSEGGWTQRCPGEAGSGWIHPFPASTCFPSLSSPAQPQTSPHSLRWE